MTEMTELTLSENTNERLVLLRFEETIVVPESLIDLGKDEIAEVIEDMVYGWNGPRALYGAIEELRDGDPGVSLDWAEVPEHIMKCWAGRQASQAAAEQEP